MRWPPSLDLALAGALTVVGVAGTIATDSLSRVDTPVGVPAVVLVVAGALSVAFRRVWPLATLAVTTGTTSAYLLLGYPYGPVFFAFFAAVYTTSSRLALRPAVGCALAALALLLPHLFTHNAAAPGLLGIAPASAWVVVPFATGLSVRLTREARQRAQAEATRRRVYDERLRIAQEVHDVVGHGLAAIKMQADIALHLLAKTPEQAERALVAISRTSTEALDEVRSTLAVVRHADTDAGTDTDRMPVPGLRRLDGLKRRMADAGLAVDLTVSGTPRELPEPVELAGYRVVQESLTNALRHGEPKVADVRVDYRADTILIEVTNPARPPAADPGRGRPGMGIPGMADRVASLGGEFSAGAVDGRFEVWASLPVGEPS